MGNGNSNGVVVKVENPFVHPGDLVKGSINLNIVKPTVMNGVFIELLGDESWSYYDFARRSTVWEHFRFISFSQELMPGGTLPAGQYCVPFELVLPHNIPGTFGFKQYGHSSSVAFHVKAFVKIPGLLKSNLKNKKELLVVQPVPENIPSLISRDVSEVTAWCCINSGKLEIEFTSEKSHVSTGDNATVIACINNNSTVDLSDLVLRVGFILEYYKNGKTRKSFSKKGWVSSVKLPGVKAGSIVNALPMSVGIPLNTQQQCLGFTVRMKYFIQLVAKVPCGSDVTCTLPLSILAARIADVQADDNTNGIEWKPTMCPAVAMDVPDLTTAPPELSLADYPDSQHMLPSAPLMQ